MQNHVVNRQNFLIFSLIFLQVFIRKISCVCNESYVVLCYEFDDLVNYEIRKDYTEVVLGTDDSSDDSDWDVMDSTTIPEEKFEKIFSLTLFRQVNSLASHSFSYDPQKSQMNYLSLSENEIVLLRTKTFHRIKLKKLSLVSNVIGHVQKMAFCESEIELIDLSDNQIEEIDKFAFATLKGTKFISLVNNSLFHIEGETPFPASLEVLRLDQNQIVTFEDNTFKNMKNLLDLSVSYNNLQALPKFDQSNKNLKYLDFSKNDLSRMINGRLCLHHLENLKILNLGSNRIQNSSILSVLENLNFKTPIKVSLAFNLLTSLEFVNNQNTQVFKNVVLFLYGNPWNCDCWPNVEYYVSRYFMKNSCDGTFFNDGTTPYCISVPEVDMCHEKVNKSILTKFSDSFSAQRRKDYEQVVLSRSKLCN